MGALNSARCFSPFYDHAQPHSRLHTDIAPSKSQYESTPAKTQEIILEPPSSTVSSTRSSSGSIRARTLSSTARAHFHHSPRFSVRAVRVWQHDEGPRQEQEQQGQQEREHSNTTANDPHKEFATCAACTGSIRTSMLKTHRSTGASQQRDIATT